MDITKFIKEQREKALLAGDYGSYRKQLSRRLLVVRKKLKYTSPKGRKYTPKDPVTAEDIASDHEYAQLLWSRLFADLAHIRTSPPTHL